MKSIVYGRQKKGFFQLTAAIMLFTMITMAGCVPNAGGKSYSIDILPPILQLAEILDKRHLRFTFDEAIVVDDVHPVINPPIAIDSIDVEKEQLIVGFGVDQEIGREYTLRMSVADESGNSLSFLYDFSGWNPRIPGILLNELNPRGTGNNPDCIELFVTQGGNLGGLLLLIGTKNKYRENFFFPAVEVSQGEYILVHAKTEGISAEIDETAGMDASGGKLASSNARDFWMRDSPGLPGNNGAVTLYARRGGPVIDAILWTNREDNDEDEKLGWTHDGFIFASDLAEAKAWTTASGGGIPFPSEAVNASFSTSTRSICRASVPEDTNSADDWHIVPTRGQTFGAANTDRVYEP